MTGMIMACSRIEGSTPAPAGLKVKGAKDHMQTFQSMVLWMIFIAYSDDFLLTCDRQHR
jgi:hypothetical protein